MHKLIKSIILSAIILPIGLQAQAAHWDCPSTAEMKHYRIQGTAQGTTFDINYYSETAKVDKSNIDSILEVIDLSMSLYRPGSLIRQFNEESTMEVTMDEHFQRVIEKSFEINRLSKGIFDITIAPLASLWGFGVDKATGIPTEIQIEKALKLVGMDKLSIKGETLKKSCPGIKIDLNGIAQGYTVDLIATYLEKYDIFNYLVELGGELRISGKKHGNQPFRIGVDRPDNSSPYIVSLNNGALTSSGYYPPGSQLSHHIDPGTGYPFAETAWQATVFAKDAMTADALDNVLINISYQKAIELIDHLKDVEFLITYRVEGGNFKEVMSSGFSQMIQ